jgi:DNA-binding GntR family transcriptional regulator
MMRSEFLERVERDVRNCTFRVFRSRPEAPSRAPDPCATDAKVVGGNDVCAQIRLLAEEGVVEIVPRRGAVVASLSPADVEEIVELRIALETMLVARAIPRLDEEDFMAVEKIVRKLDKTRTMDEQLALNVDFHSRLYVKAERPRTLATLEKLRLAFEPYLRLLWARSDYKSHSQDDHREIVSLCRSRNVKGVQKVLASHIAKTGQEIMHLLSAD